MEESELEEGEACTYHDNRDNDGYNSSIDPDVALSYIDEKIQDVLGHFQKDFEGGVSAENLGAKFGGYGSFLPAYQRSPASSNSRSPSKVRQDDALKPSRTLQLEAAIYSGLGLDVSPSSSLEESHHGTGGILHEHQDVPLESPTSILQIMTSFPVSGDVLLSPLPDNLLKLPKTEKALEDCRSVIVSGLGLRGSDYIKDSGKVSRRKKVKSQERNDIATVSKSSNRKASWNSHAIIGSSELDIDRACKEIASRTLLHRLVSNVDIPLDDMTGSSGETLCKSVEGNESIVREKGFDDLLEEETLNHKLTHGFLGVEKPEIYPTGKFLEDREEVPVSDCLVQVKKDNHYKGHEKYGIKASSKKQDHLNMPPTKGQLSSRGKKKSKASQNQVMLGTDVSEGTWSGLSSYNRSMKNFFEGESNSKTDLCELKADKYVQKRDGYEDIFEDMGLEEEQYRMAMQASGTVKGNMLVPDGGLGERSKGKMIGKLSTMEDHFGAAPEVVPCSDKFMLGATLAVGFPSSEEDKWVYCDKCQKCRLLPPGTNPQNLPDKWVCSMLDWLPPGMKSCSISQEETTNAVRAMCQATVPDAQNHVKGNSGLPNIVSSSPNYDEMNTHRLQILPGKVNKKCPAEVYDFAKKNMQISAKTRSLNDVKHSSLEGEDDLLQLSNSSHGRAASQALKEDVPKHSSEGGDVSKSKFRKDHDRGHSKSSKKARNMGINDGDCTSDHDILIRRVGKNSNSTLLTDLHMENQKCHNEASLNVSTYDTLGKSDFTADHPSRKAPASMNNEIMEVGAPDEGEFIAKRRKIEEFQSYPTSLSPLPTGGHHLEENGVLMVENKCKEGKVRVVNSKISENRQNRRIDEESDQIKNLQLNNDLVSTGLASMKRECRLMQPSVRATSSSSKASGSLKSKATRGSPSESVSSLPRRSSKPENLTMERQTISEKHDFEDPVIIPVGGPYSNGEVVGRSGHSRSGRKDETSAAAPNGSHESSMLDPRMDNLSGNSDKAKVAPSPDISNHPFLQSVENNFGHDNQYPRPLDSDKCSAEERKNEKSCSSSNLNIKGSEKVSSSQSKDKYRKSHPEVMDSSKLLDSCKDMQDYGTDNEGRPRDVRSNQENSSVKGDKVECKHAGKKDSAGKPDWYSKRKSRSNLGDARCSEDAISSPNCGDCEFSLKKTSSRKADQVEIVSEREKALALPDFSTYEKEIPKDSSKPVLRSRSTNGVENLPASLSSADDALKMPRQIRKADHQNGNQQKTSHHFTSNGHRIGDINAPSPVRRDSASHATVNALEEAKDLKHLADRLKNGGSNGESIGLYFQAALKFLHGAALLEPSNSESSKRGDMVRSIQIYGSTAKLCEFCAREYEKSKDMASAALAYKCMEVAYLKVVYSLHNSAGKDHQELQTALKMIPPAKVEKVGQSKDASPPQIAGSQTISATKRPNFVRLLNFAQNVSSAMEASKKSRIAFSAARTNCSDPKFKEAIPSIKTALDYNFHNVESLLQLVRLATEAISR